MSRAFRVLSKVAWWLVSFRPLRLVLVVLFLLWSADRALVFATDAAYFYSLGLAATFWRTRALALGTFFLFFLLALLLAIPFLRASAKPVSGDLAPPEIPLRLAFLDDWHAKAPKFSWLLVLFAAFYGAHRLENLWPRAATILDATWDFTLVLLIVVFLGGGVRALPFLAAKNPIAPARWLRALQILGVFALVLRALGYAQTLILPANSGFEFWLGRALAALGVAMASLAIFQIARRAPRRQIAFGTLGALFLPAVLSVLLWPFFFWLPFPQTRAAPTAPALSLAGAKAPRVPIERGLPVWSEEILVQNARAQRTWGGENPGVVEWQNAALFFDGDKWRAGVVGQKPQSGGALPDLEADAAQSQVWLPLDLSRTQNGNPREENGFAPARPAFYGLEGPPLFSNHPRLGASFGGVWKILWSLRLRNPTLALEGARFERILPFRGVSQSAGLVWPELEWRNPRPFWDAPNRGWLWLAEGFEGEKRLVYALQNPADGQLEFRRASSFSRFHPFRDRVMGVFAPGQTPFFADENWRPDPSKKRAGDREIWWGTRKIWLHQLGPDAEIFEARVEALARPFRGAPGERLEKGAPAFYPDPKAPGGAWVARGFFVIKAEKGRETARLWRVGLSGLTDSPVGWGEDLIEARRDFDLRQRLETIKTTPVAREKLEVRALELQRRATLALRAGRYVEFNRLNTQLREVLEELAKR